MEKFKELICYGFVGACTTFVNYFIYYLCLWMDLNWLMANSLAWIVAVIFAYFANRNAVFHSQKEIKKEFIQFFILRFITLLIENILLAISINGFGISSAFSKILVSIFTVLSNYYLCKLRIFQKKETCYE